MVQVALAAKCSLALTSDGEVYSFGHGPLGELGLGRLFYEEEEEEEDEEEDEEKEGNQKLLRQWHFNRV